MKISYLILAAAALTCIACTKAEYAGTDIYAILKGKVTDEEGTPIEHMEVTLELSKRTDPKTFYTSSDGTFICDISNKEARTIKDISITLTDTDGEENGGLFKTLTEEIHLYDETAEESPMTLNLDFRCSRTTL